MAFSKLGKKIPQRGIKFQGRASWLLHRPGSSQSSRQCEQERGPVVAIDGVEGTDVHRTGCKVRQERQYQQGLLLASVRSIIRLADATDGFEPSPVLLQALRALVPRFMEHHELHFMPNQAQKLCSWHRSKKRTANLNFRSQLTT